VLAAIGRPTIDHRGPEFSALCLDVLAGLKEVFKTRGHVVIYPGSGTGAWEAALVNALSPGDHILMYETGHFADLWHRMAANLGFSAEIIPGDWRRGADASAIEARLRDDRERQVKAVCIVHNETSTGVTSNIREVRKAIDRADHPALLLVDTVSSLASIDYRMDEWGVDVTIGGSQKGLMLPPGLSFNAVSEKAVTASQRSSYAKEYWAWEDIIAANRNGYFPYTPSTNLLYGLKEALAMLSEEGLENVFARHSRHAAATRCAVEAWGLDLVCANPAEYSATLTAVMVPEGSDADAFREVALEQFNMSLGIGLGRFAKKVFRIGHLGSFNDLMLAGTLGGVEMALGLAGIPFKRGGVQAALDYLATTLEPSASETANA